MQDEILQLWAKSKELKNNCVKCVNDLRAQGSPAALDGAGEALAVVAGAEVSGQVALVEVGPATAIPRTRARQPQVLVHRHVARQHRPAAKHLPTPAAPVACM